MYLDPNNTDFLKNILPRTNEWHDEATDVEYMYETAYRRMCYQMAFWVSDRPVITQFICCDHCEPQQHSKKTYLEDLF